MDIPRIGLAATFLVAAGLTLGGCSGGDGNGATTAVGSDPASGSSSGAVTIKSFDYSPSPAKVKAGTKVTWTNDDSIRHTVTSGKRGATDGKYDLVLEDKGATASHTFDAPGTFPYHCTIHPAMDGVVEVS